MEEYTQLTLDDWLEMKENLKQDLIGVQESFVRIGYTLRTIEEQELYKRDGYETITEFAKADMVSILLIQSGKSLICFSKSS